MSLDVPAPVRLRPPSPRGDTRPGTSEVVARIFSAATNPAVVLTAGQTTALVWASGTGSRWWELLGWAALCSGGALSVLPVALAARAAHRGGVLDGAGPARADRTVPFLVLACASLLALVVGTAFTGRAMTDLVLAVWLVPLVGSLVFAVLNRCVTKLSVHVGTLAGAVVAAVHLVGVEFLVPGVVLVLGCAWSRRVLRAHDVAQLALGAAAGVCVTASVLALVL